MENTPAPTRLERLFHEALERPPQERSSFLAAACHDDPELRSQVLSLITAFEQETGFLETPVLEETGATVSQMLCAAGQMLGHYRIRELIGRGGMGDVYLALDNTLGRKVALKLLPLQLSVGKTGLGRFWLEARTASSLNHPNIMTVYEIGDDHGLHYIAAEYVEGSTVRQLLAHGPLSPERIVNIAIQAASGLMAAHAAGIIHRDIKPENIMVRPDGYVKILDFGLAKLTEAAMARQIRLSSEHSMATVPGLLLGTVGYMSPEQARGLDLDQRSDLFSLGTVIYEMATGKCPFAGKTPSDALSSILHEEPAAIPEAALLPLELARLVDKLLCKDREQRYQSAEELIADLQSLQRQASTPSVASTQVPPPPNKSRVWRGAILAAALLLLVFATAAVFRSHLPGRSVNATQPWGFSCRLQMQAAEGRQGQEIVLPAREPLKFAAGQRIRLSFSSPASGYLYLLDQATGSDGKPSELAVLFPSPTANGGSSFVPAGAQIPIPRESWLQFDAERGTDKLWLVWSANGLPLLDGLRKYANVHDRGRVRSAAEEQAARNFLETNYKPQELDLAGMVIAARGNSRMLVWQMDLEHN